MHAVYAQGIDSGVKKNTSNLTRHIKIMLGLSRFFYLLGNRIHY